MRSTAYGLRIALGYEIFTQEVLGQAGGSFDSHVPRRSIQDRFGTK